MSTELEIIKKGIKQKKIVVGTERSIKNIKLGKAEKVYLSSNCPADARESINHYARLSNTKVVELPYSNDELNVVCKKPFVISVLVLLKGEN